MKIKNKQIITAMVLFILCTPFAWQNMKNTITPLQDSNSLRDDSQIQNDSPTGKSDEYFNNLYNFGTSPKISAEYQSSLKYDWWNIDWTYRFPIEINSTNINRTDYSINTQINFTSVLEDLSLTSETFDQNSVRVVEYDNTGAEIIANNSYSDSQKYLLHSRFILEKDVFDANNNATGRLWFTIPGLIELNCTRVVMVYFDILANGPKEAINSAIQWNTNYNWYNDPIRDGNYHLAYGSQRKDASIGYGEFTSWNSDLTQTIGNPGQWDYLQTYFDMGAGDFDGDGNVELLMNDIGDDFKFIDYNNQTGLWESIWNGRYYFEGLNASYGSTHYDIYTWDMDHDGKTDIIAPDYQSGYPGVAIYGLNGSSHDLIIKQFLQTPYRIMHATLADLNQDGWMDIIVGNYGGISYSFGYFLYNTTSGNYDWYGFTSDSTDRHIPSSTYSILADDIDYDGKIEVLIGGNYYGYVHIWEWNGTGLEWKTNFNTYTVNGIISDVEDWDNDGRKEILMGNYENTNETSIRVYEVNGDNSIDLSHMEWFNDGISYSRITFPRFADPDNDGQTEIVAGSFRGPDVDDYYDAIMMVWEQSDNVNPEWTSPKEGQSVGLYYIYSSQMTDVFGSYDRHVCIPEPTTQNYSPEIKPPDLTVQVFDIDKHPVQGLGVILDNKTGNSDYSSILITDSEGKVTFTDIAFETYNLNISIENQMGNHSVYSKTIVVNQTREFIMINTDLWAVSFKVKDVDGTPLSMGNVTLFNGTWSDTSNFAEYQLNSVGETSLMWINRPPNESYNYSVLYNNPYYSPETTSILNSSFEQQGLTQESNDFNATIPTDLTGGNYEYNWKIFANGSTDTTIGDQYINWVKISLSNVSTYITKVEIYGLDDQGSSNLEKIFASDFSSGIVQSWVKGYYLWNNTKSKSYIGIEVHVYTHNDSIIPQFGILNLEIQESYTLNVQLPIAQEKINLIDSEGIPIQGAFVKIYQNDSSLITTLTTDDLGTALDPQGFNFWYCKKNGSAEQGKYKIKIEYAGAVRSFKNNSDGSPILSDNYNFTLEGYNEVNFKVNVNPLDYPTDLQIINGSGFQSIFDFEENLSFLVNVTTNYAQDSNPAYSIDAKSVQFTLSNTNSSEIVVYNTSATHISTGIYRIFIDPQIDRFSVLEGSNSFLLTIAAHVVGYGGDPDQIVKPITINPIPTTGALYDDTTLLGSTLEVYYGTTLDLTVVYQAHGTDVSGGTAFVDWDFDVQQPMVQQTNAGFTNYTYSIDTSKISALGQYRIEVSVDKTNYTGQALYFDLIVKEINTTINSADYASPIDVYWGENFTFTVNYTDIVNDLPISNSSVYYYLFGDPEFIQHPMKETATPGIYEITINSTDPQFGQTGTYNFQVLAEKDYYRTMQVWITVNINIVPTELNVHNSDILIVANQNFTISASFIDIRRGGSELIDDANVSIDISGPNSYENLINIPYIGSGDYNITLSTNDFPVGGTFIFNVIAMKNQFETQSHAISVEIQSIPTNLTTANDEISIYWTQDIVLECTYEDISNELSPTPISGANVSYKLQNNASFTGSLSEIGITGTYNMNVSSMALETKTYIFIISATKTNCSLGEKLITVNILSIETDLTSINNTQYSVIWKNNFTIGVEYRDNLNDILISGAEITYSVGQVSGFEGNITYIKDNHYEITFNSTQFPGVGSYTLSVQAEKSNYVTTLLNIFIDIMPINTRIENSIFLSMNYTMNVTTSHQFILSYTDIEGNGIPSADVAYYEWEFNGETYIGYLQDLGLGNYLLDFNTANRTIGTYMLVIHIAKDNFVERAGSITLQILAKPISVALNTELQDNVAKQPQGNDIIIELTLVDPVANGAPLTGATVSMSYRNNNYLLNETSPGVYRYVIKTGTDAYNALFAAETDSATISIQKANYTIAPITITISVTPPEYNIAGAHIPRIFIYIGGGVALLSIIIVGAVQYIKYQNIPEIIKKIDKTKKSISKKMTLADENITRTYEEIMVDKYGSVWKLLDLDLKDLLGISDKVSEESSFTKGEESEGGAN